jgi:hypothetical protein
MAPRCHRYSRVTCPNRRSRCLSLNLPISKSVVRLNATDPAWPNTFQSPCARCIAAAGLGQSMGSPAAMPPLMKSKGNATKKVISAIRSHFVSCSLREVSQEKLTGENHQGSSSTAPNRPPDGAALPRGRVPRRDRAYQISRRTLHNLKMVRLREQARSRLNTDARRPQCGGFLCTNSKKQRRSSPRHLISPAIFSV